MTKTKSFSKKIIVPLVAITMILTVGLLAACDIGGLSLEQRLTNLETEVTQLEANASTMENGALLEEIARLRGDADALQEEAAANGKSARVQVVQTRLMVLYNGNGGNKMRHPYSSQEIYAELENEIRQAFLSKQTSSDLTLKDVFIPRYFGTFNYASAITIQIVGDGIGNAIWEEEVAGILFSSNIWIPIEIWHDGGFLTLTQSYELNLLTISDLQTIASKHNNQ